MVTAIGQTFRLQANASATPADTATRPVRRTRSTAKSPAVAAAVITGGLVLIIVMRKVGGYTGDTLGAIQQVAEIAVILTLLGVWP